MSYKVILTNYFTLDYYLFFYKFNNLTYIQNLLTR